jgi:hypothetical protein
VAKAPQFSANKTGEGMGCAPVPELYVTAAIYRQSNGDRDIAAKLYLNGRFAIESGSFTAAAIEEKVSSL